MAEVWRGDLLEAVAWSELSWTGWLSLPEMDTTWYTGGRLREVFFFVFSVPEASTGSTGVGSVLADGLLCLESRRCFSERSQIGSILTREVYCVWFARGSR